jgi:hypothetical protein
MESEIRENHQVFRRVQLAAQPGFQLVENDAAPLLAHRPSLVRAAATDGKRCL